jgi:hypothetical protein
MTYKLIDPLAQSFFIDRPTTITKVDLFFSAKDDTLPAFTHIRKNQNGQPGPYIVPFSEVYIYPDKVNVTANASVATTVTFSSPIFLDIGEYSITLGSDSKNYRVWVSELDGIDTISEKRITEQPYIGSLFKSQNASTWTPVETEDLKFNIYRAVFDTSSPATISFTADTSPYSYKVLGNNPLEAFPDVTTLRVHHLNHGMVDGSYVKLSGVNNAQPFANVVNSFFGIPSSEFVDVPMIVGNVTLDTYTVNTTTAANANLILSSTRFGGAGVVASQNLQFDTIYPVISAVTHSKSIVDPSYKATSTNYSVDTLFTPIETNDNDLEDTKIIAGDVTTEFNLANTNSFTYQIQISTTDSYVAPLVDMKQLGLVLAKNLVDTPTYSNKNLSQDIITVTTTALANVTALSNIIGVIRFANANVFGNVTAITPGTFVNISGTNPNNGQFRVISVEEAGANLKIASLNGSIITDANVSNTYTITNGTNFVAEEASSGGSVFSKYITRQIDFINNSTSLNLRVDVCKPVDADVTFYYKIKEIGDTEILSNKEFIKITDLVVPTSLSGEFFEVEKQLNDLPAFNAVVVKAVFTSLNTARVPKIKNLRLIALA